RLVGAGPGRGGDADRRRARPLLDRARSARRRDRAAARARSLPMSRTGWRHRYPSPRFRAEREGPIAQQWEGEVGLLANALESPTSPRPSPPPGAEREKVFR